jgi:uncharacterized heparinase superfamily protein
LKKPGLADRIALTSLVVGQGAKRLRRGLAAPLRLASVWRAPAPERLVIAPQDLRTADPTIADDIYGGYFVFHGKAVNTHGESPFVIEPPSPAWSEALLSFGWLRHLRAADTMLARANARALTLDWMRLHGAPPGGDPAGRQAMQTGWSAETTARRVLAWIAHSPLILDGADRLFYRRFMKSLARQCAWLSHALAGGLEGEARLFAAAALAEFAICADVAPGRRRRALRLLEREIAAQILPDGGHVTRNPRMVVDALLTLLPLRQAFAASGAQTPQSLITAIDRMLPMLRMLRHEDGALALFNGMGATRPDLLATLLAYEDSAAGSLAHAPQSGYLRLDAGDVGLIADVGAAPPRAFSCEAHAGALSFELTCAGQRLIVNCGAPERGRGALREAARQTAAHSTLTLADVSSARFAPTTALSEWLDGQILAGAREVTVERAGDGTHVATHDGYLRRFGLRHRRALRLDARSLQVTDELIPDQRGPAEAPPFAMRLHLHPSIRCALNPTGSGVLIEPPAGDAWAFHCEGESVAIEESAFFASHEGPRPTRQIVVERPAGPLAPLVWRLERLRR